MKKPYKPKSQAQPIPTQLVSKNSLRHVLRKSSFLPLNFIMFVSTPPHKCNAIH